jgi:hypothetical protein
MGERLARATAGGCGSANVSADSSAGGSVSGDAMCTHVYNARDGDNRRGRAVTSAVLRLT